MTGDRREKLDFLLMHFKVDSALANYPSAIKHYQLYTTIKDSIFNKTKSKQIEELGVRYETGKKEQDLKLKEKNIALLREQNKAQQTQRNALVGGTALLLSLLALGYNRYRLKQRSNQLLEAQQQKLQAQQQALQTQHQELQAQKDVLQAQQQERYTTRMSTSQSCWEKRTPCWSRRIRCWRRKKDCSKTKTTCSASRNGC
jgi:hypothetical protein